MTRRTKQTLSTASGFLLAYLIVAPALALLPSSMDEMQPWIRGYVDQIAGLVPMIDRVLVYGYQYPEKQRAFLAYAWTCVPLLMWIDARLSSSQIRREWGPKTWELWIGSIFGFSVALLIAWAVWYWPNFPFHGKDVLGPISHPFDGRRRLFLSDLGMTASVPVIAFGFASMLNVVVRELRIAFRRLTGRSVGDLSDSQ